eukprot:CAMPEP_0198473970 /NCGR_PEP_ID=MMETSP1456-20131121/37514_1 /TAXON_ID=1461544 ORGANISM="Unidentified sp., Strain RCC1871" /NCGR_SAMPLE_ID=MMETSP1456 /ASSEMBLY_ACC=CAM_ASM_001119 /LENGTH=39 /DNA_ID= /DNA_START= /DNA_END= /DNA_ORIENTATION=
MAPGLTKALPMFLAYARSLPPPDAPAGAALLDTILTLSL